MCLILATSFEIIGDMIYHVTRDLLFHSPWNKLYNQLAYFCRYLLRRSALELFMVDRSNFFFDFGVFHF